MEKNPGIKKYLLLSVMLHTVAIKSSDPEIRGLAWTGVEITAGWMLGMMVGCAEAIDTYPSCYLKFQPREKELTLKGTAGIASGLGFSYLSYLARSSGLVSNVLAIASVGAYGYGSFFFWRYDGLKSAIKANNKK